MTTLAAGPAQATPWPTRFGATDCRQSDLGLKTTRVPDPNDVTKYSTCSMWFQGKKSCKRGKVFSPTKLKCVKPQPAESPKPDSSQVGATVGK
ncbi:carbohydrate-binding module family 14 protein [Streptomyces sp. NPDC000410]|uniref:carbohydrate-binding module family 14 protein n=1 Tax=Streptomyces sp. NPDC000410 TaxID=3154254 RepID=UPI00332E1710